MQDRRQSPMSDDERIADGQPSWVYHTAWGDCVIYRPKRYQANSHFARIYKRETAKFKEIERQAEATLQRLSAYASEMHRKRRQEEIAAGMIPLDERTLFDLI